MDSQSQNEPDSTVEKEAQDLGDKKDRNAKKSWRGSKQMYSKIMAQVEFYFSPSNLAKDRFMSNLTQKDPCKSTSLNKLVFKLIFPFVSVVPLSTFMSFNKIKNLLNGGNEAIIKKALMRSSVLELSGDQTKVRRKEDAPVKTQEQIDDCTIYVEQIPVQSNHESMKSIFERFGAVAYVSLPRYKKSRQIKQFGFVEFEDQESIVKAIQCFKKFDGVLQYASLKAENLLSIVTHEKEDTEKVEQKDESDGNCEPPAKKVKVEDEAVEICVEAEVVEEFKTDIEMPLEEDTKEEKLESDEIVKKKKNRQHKKKSGSAKLQDERIMAMKIMRKKEWKKMRNAYLNLERQKAKEIKKILRESYNKRNNNKTPSQAKFSPAIASPRINFYGSPNEREEAVQETDTQNDTNTSSGLTFAAGVIVNIKFREQCLDFKELKKEFKQYPYVQYVDILEGGAQCFIRVDVPNSAQELVNQYSSCEYETDVLKDDAEKEYWKKIFDKRDLKKTKDIPKKEQPPVKKRRGREKLLDKIAKAAQHIRFEEAEDAVE